MYFSAVYNDPDSGDIADHYRLQVNKSSDFSGRMMWDSKKTAMSNVNEGSRCDDITYGGQALSLNKIKYYWRLKFWDDEGNEGAWSAVANFEMAGSGAGEAGAGPWEEDVLEPSGEAKVEIPRRSGQWTALGDIIRVHTSVNKNPLDAIELAQTEVTCSNISKGFNSFEEASEWYKQLEGFAVQVKLGCKVGGTPISRKLFTGIISAVNPNRSTLTAELRVIDFLDYFGRVTIKETPVWEDISLTQLYKNLVELAFPEWVEGVDYFVEDLGAITVQIVGYENLNLISELKHIAESRGMRVFTDVNGKLVCRSRNVEGEAWQIKHDYNLYNEGMKERRDLKNVLNWIVVHARPYEVGYEDDSDGDIGPNTTPPGKIAGFTATPSNQQIALSWSNPADTDFEKVRINCSTSAYPLNVDDGTNIYEGTGESKTHTGLTNGKRYYYSAWTKDTTGNWSGAAHVSAVAGAGGGTWPDDTGTSPVLGFGAYPEYQKIILAWRNPQVTNFEEVVIRKSTTSYPATPTSGSSEYTGTAETHTDTGLNNGVRYYYSLFVKNTAGKYSSACFASAIPGGLRKTLDAEVITGSQNCGWFNIWTSNGYVYQCKVGAYFDRYEITKRLGFATKGATESWLKFRHEWDIQIKSGPSHSGSQQHAVGVQDNLGLSFSHSCGPCIVRVTKISFSTKAVRIDYKLTYTGGKMLGITFRNKLTLKG